MQDFKDLKVWTNARQFVTSVYRATRDFPAEERFGLVAQLRRSALSIPSNIAEGAGRGTRPDFARFVDLALGSANEAECQLILAHDLGFVCSEVHDELLAQLEEIRRMATSLSRKLRDTASSN